MAAVDRLHADRLQTDRLQGEGDRSELSRAEYLRDARVNRSVQARRRAEGSRQPEPALLELATLVRMMHRETLLERRVRIGSLIFERLFAGSRLAWTAKESRGHTGFRRLAQLLRGTISKSDLHRCVATYLLCERCPFVLQASDLTVSHCDAVAGLCQSEQESLLRRAMESGWSAAQTSKEKRRRLSQMYPKARGRPAKLEPEPATILARVMVLLERIDQGVALTATSDDLVRSREVLSEQLLQAERCCWTIRQRLQAPAA